jgi:hypothetical protein
VVVEAETLQDYLERGALPLHHLRHEDPVTVMAVPELHGLQFLIPLAFPGDAGPLTVDAALGVRADEGRCERERERDGDVSIQLML